MAEEKEKISAKGMVSAVCVDFRAKQILFVLNTDAEKPLGFYGHPGGKMKEGETPEMAVIRELAQETNQEGKVTKYIVAIPKTGSKGDYIHYFILVIITSRGKELKNYEDPLAIPRWIPLEEIITGRVKMFRGHIRGLMMVLEKMAEEKERVTKDTTGRINKNRIRILSDGPSPASKMLDELKEVFDSGGRYTPFFLRKK
jgi:8-oxo-dGTP pyrophosphatase MutT (NUDIX family)